MIKSKFTTLEVTPEMLQRIEDKKRKVIGQIVSQVTPAFKPEISKESKEMARNRPARAYMSPQTQRPN